MNKKTNAVVFYIILFFVTIVIGLGSFFAYKILVTEPEQEQNTSFLDKDFNNIIKQKEKESEERKNQKEKEYADYKNPPCAVKGKIYEHGTIKKFYSRAGVGVYESCGNFEELKKCDNGQWLGNPKFIFTSCNRTVDCKLNEDISVENGDSVELYSREIVPYGGDCEIYKGIRICKETILAGDAAFKYSSCKVSNKGICKIANQNGGENILADERSHTFYSKSSVNYNESCSNISQKRLCSKGVLYGGSEFYSWTCNQKKAKDCIIGDIEIKHGTSRTMYSKPQATAGNTCRFYASPEERACVDGSLSGQEEYMYSYCSS